MPHEWLKAWEEQAPGVPAPRAYQSDDGLTALVGREPVAPSGGPDGGPDLRWHVSLRMGNRDDPSCRVPTWDELVNAAHELRPGVVFCIGIPPRAWWMNLHPHVLHLWELRDDNLTDQWRAEAQGQTPS